MFKLIRFLIRIGQKLIKPLMLIVCIMLIVMLQFGFIFLLLAMLPSMSAYFVDEDPERANFRTIFACNLAATIPFLKPMFVFGLKFKHYEVGSVIADPKTWLFIYTGAAIGWAMLYCGKHIAFALLSIQYKLRVIALERAQTRLLDEWGDKVRQLTDDRKALLQKEAAIMETEDHS